MELKNDIPSKEDRDFIVDDGDNHDEDSTYEPKILLHQMMINMLLLVKSLKN